MESALVMINNGITVGSDKIDETNSRKIFELDSNY